MIRPDRQAARSAPLGLLLALAVGLSGCATRPAGFMSPIGHSVQGAQTVDMIVATDRHPSPDPAVLYTGERSREMSLSEVVVSIPPAANRKRGRIQWPHHRTPNPNKEFATLSAVPVTPPQINDWMAGMPAESRGHLLIFVHGYNTPFDRGTYLFAQVVNDTGMRAAPMIFSWPSRGRTLDYDYDRESVTAARTDLATVLEQAIASENVTDVTVLAHSMGGWLTMEALRTLALTHGAVPAKIHNVILASPDIDVDVFLTQYLDLGAQPPAITLFVSQDDKALRLSRLIGGNVDRLGAIDFGKEPYHSGIEKAGIRVVDLSKVRGSDQSNHLKFSESPDIVSLVGNALIDGQPLSDNPSSVYEKMGVLVIGGSRLGVETTNSVIGRKP